MKLLVPEDPAALATLPILSLDIEVAQVADPPEETIMKVAPDQIGLVVMANGSAGDVLPNLLLFMLRKSTIAPPTLRHACIFPVVVEEDSLLKVLLFMFTPICGF